MAKIYKSVEELIGNTPLLELTKIEKETGATLLAKVEALNPGGSAKDRIAKRMVEDAEKAWDYLMYLGYGARDVMVAGDSAGGNLALVLCHQLKQAGRQLPGKLVLMSPWTDMTASGRSYTQRAEIDPTITMDYIRAVREVYADGKDLTSPFLSPLFGDFTGFPPTLIQVGTNEILYSDSIRLRERMLADNVHCQLEVWNDMWHVFQMFPTRKSALAMESIGKFLLD